MPTHCRCALVVSLSAHLLYGCTVSNVAAQEVWSGYSFAFDHPSGSSVADEITPNVILNRSSTGGIYNAAYESAYELDYSPAHTLWATDFNNPGAEVAAANWMNLEFTDWRSAYGGAPALGENIVNSVAVVHLSLDDVYLDLRFTNWGVGFGGGGAFRYERAEPIPEPAGWLLVALVVGIAQGRRRR